MTGTRIRRMGTNRSAGSPGEIDETIERRMTAEVEEHTNLKWRGAKVTDQLWPRGRRELFTGFHTCRFVSFVSFVSFQFQVSQGKPNPTGFERRNMSLYLRARVLRPPWNSCRSCLIKCPRLQQLAPHAVRRTPHGTPYAGRRSLRCAATEKGRAEACRFTLHATPHASRRATVSRRAAPSDSIYPAFHPLHSAGSTACAPSANPSARSPFL